nr:NADH dehydrogenase subunit 2 [Neohydatothrips samayunkur]
MIYEMKNVFLSQYQMFMFILFLTLFMGISSNSFLGIWMSMEINLIIIIPLMSTNEKKNVEKSMMIYFLIQSISSLMAIFSCLMSMNNEMYNMNNFMSFTMMISMMGKLGVFPFHMWILTMLESLSWNTCFYMLTFQKILPLLTLFLMMQETTLILFSLMNSVFAAIGGLTFFSIRKILVFSSMNHLSLMLFTIILSKKLLKIYFTVYIIMNMVIMQFFYKTNLSFLFQIFKNKKDKLSLFMILTVFFSLMGIPPFLGFMPKMMVIMKLMQNDWLYISFMIILLNVVSSFFYLRITLSSLLISFIKNKMKSKKVSSMSFLIIIFSPIVIFF